MSGDGWPAKTDPAQTPARPTPSSWAPELDYDEQGNRVVPADPVSAIYQAIGAATSPTNWHPDGVFNDRQARNIAEGLIAHLRLYPLPPDPPAELATRIRTATVIRTGDHVLLSTIEGHRKPSELERMQGELAALFPGVTFVFVAGVTDIAVRSTP